MGPGRTVRPLPHREQPRQAAPQGAWLADEAAPPCCSGGKLSGVCSIFFAFSALPFLPVLEEACGAWASSQAHLFSGRSLMGTCGHSNCLFILVQGSGSLSHPVMTLSSLWGRNKEPLDPGDAEEFRGQAYRLPGWNTEGLCDVSRLPNPVGKEHTMETPSPS